MSEQYNSRLISNHQVLLSIAGLLLVLTLILFPPTVNNDLLLRKTLIGSIFNSICLLGILAVFFPNLCKKILRIKNEVMDFDSAKTAAYERSYVLKGHHPTCGKYFAHVLRIGNYTFCAACIGLFLGGLLALSGGIGYFHYGLDIVQNSKIVIMLGIFGISLGLVQFKFRGYIRLLVNTYFVFGAMLVLIGIDALVHSLFFDLFAICLITFWLFTRIALSRWDHKIICFSCKIENCQFRA